MTTKRCVTCGRETSDYVAFKCPVCEEEIVRCATCRSRGNPWTCPTCGYTDG
ncbi:TPA: RNA-binding protein [Candidatus Micrarchaeota archaeon]|nr:RNA-binding protein [Candidatus Micrarchaeota archaeon]